jgi:hypothetical protein
MDVTVAYSSMTAGNIIKALIPPGARHAMHAAVFRADYCAETPA